jgi:hypothetical protein
VVIQEYVTAFKLEDSYSPDYMYNLAVKEMNGSRVLEAANLIIKFNLDPRFNLKEVILQLVEHSN